MHKLCQKLIEVGAANRFRDLGATSIKMATSRAARYVYRTMGIEMIRGTAALKPYRVGVILAGDTSAKSAAIRRRESRNVWEAQQEAYYYSHNHGTEAHERPW